MKAPGSEPARREKGKRNFVAMDVLIRRPKQKNCCIRRDVQVVYGVLPVFLLCFCNCAINGKDLDLVVMHLAAFSQIKTVERVDSQSCKFNDGQPDNQKQAGASDKGTGKKAHFQTRSTSAART